MSSAAIEHAECAVCFEPLYSSPVAVLVDSRRRKRTCRHFFHSGCLSQMPQRVCPICRVAFDAITVVPDPAQDGSGWFNVVDLNGDKKLSKNEVLDVLKSTLPINWRELEQSFSDLWQQWDVDGSGYIDKNEMIHPQRGLMQFILSAFPRPSAAPSAPPALQQKAQWFDYWDEDRSGTLDKGEVTRALCKSFGLGRPREVTGIREVLENVWCIFDTDGNGSIDRAEFMQADGLADTFLATMMFAK